MARISQRGSSRRQKTRHRQPKSNLSQDAGASERVTLSRREFLTGAAVAAGAAAVVIACGPSVTVPNPNPAGGFEITGLEAVQSVQKPDNSIPLVQGKRTIIRVYVETFGSTPVPNITGVLDISTAHGPLATNLQPITGPTISAPVHGTLDRNNLSHSLNFELPPETLISLDPPSSPDFDHHRVTAKATVFLQGQRTASSPDRSAEFTFIRGTSRHLQPILLSSAAYAPPNMLDFTQSLQGARTRFPIAAGGFTVAAPTNTVTPFTIDITSDAAWYALIAELEQPDFVLYLCVPGWCPADGVRVGLLQKPTPPIGTNIFGIGAGFPYGAMAAYAASGPGDLPLAQQIFAHEMAHAFGLLHAHDTCGAGIPWGDSPPTTDQPGIDVPARQIIPTGTPDLMSYCSSPNGPNWTSSVTYRDLLSSVAGIAS